MPPPADADADALLAAEQAAEASALWVGGDFDAAHQTLQRLEATLPTDARVQLNLWVAGYYADGGSSLDTLAKELAGWLKAHPAAPTDVQQYNTHALAAVNYGLILFLQQQHATALSVLEPLFEEVDILQDGTGLCLCTLLLEIYLDCCQLPKAVEVLQYLQNQAAAAKPAVPLGADVLGVPAGDAGSSSSNQGSPSAVAARDSSSRSPVKQQEGQQAAGPAGGIEGQTGVQQQDGGGEQGPVVPLSQALPVLSKTKGQRMQEVFQLVREQGGKPSGQDLDPLLHLYKARLALACQNHKAAKKEVRGLLSCEPDSPAALLLKAELETSRQQPRKALKTLGPLLTAAHQHTIRCRLQLLNLLAAIHSQLDKHHLAALYLSTALELHAEVQEQQQPKPPPSKPDPQQQRKQQGKRQQQKKQQQQQGTAAAAGEQAPPGGPAPAAPPGAGVPRKSHWLMQDMSDALSYNMGLQQLALQDWQGAMESFEAASSKYFTQPQLWLRWGEACLGMYHVQLQQQQLASLQNAAGAGGLSTATGGKGKAGGKQGKGQAVKKQQQQQQQGSSPEQLLQQAAAHLSTGLVLLQEQQAAAAKQLEAATAAAAAAIAAGEPPPDPAFSQAWPLIGPLAAAAAGAGGGPSSMATAAAGSSSSSPTPGGTAAAGTSSAAAAASAAGTSGSAVGSAATGSAPVGASSMPYGGSGIPADAALLTPELAAVRQALLSNKAYVALQLGQPQEALEAAQELVACSRMSPQQHYLGTSYAAEALCLLGRVDEARLQLQAHIGLFMQHSSTSGGGLLGDTDPGSSSSATATAAHHAAAGSVGPVPAAAAAAPSLSDAAVAGSTKSFDGSCISCSKGVCGHTGHAGASGAGGGPSIMDQAALLHNLGAVLVLQGQHEEGHRHAAIAAALKHAVLHGTQQDAESVLRAYAAGQGSFGPHMG